MKIFSYLKELHDRLVEHSSRLRFDKQHPWHLNLIALYGSMIELSGGIIILIDRKAFTGIPSILRTLIETYVEFHNLANDSEYGYYMEASHLKQWLNIYREAKTCSNPYLAAIGKLQSLDEEIRKSDERLKELRRNGYKELKIAKKFEMAGMSDVYTSIYNFLCTDSHSNIRALIKRHMDIQENDFVVVYYKDEPLETFISTIDTTCGLLVDASIQIHRLLESSEQTRIEELKNKFESIREIELC